MTSPEIAAQVIEHARISTGQRVLEPSAGKAALASAARNAGADVTCVELQPGFAHELRVIHGRSEEHTSELQSLMRISYAVFCLKKKNTTNTIKSHHYTRNHNHNTTTRAYG